MSTDYRTRLLLTQPANLIGYWALDDTSGLVAHDYSPQADDGAYRNGPVLSGDTALSGQPCPTFDGVNDDVNIDSVAFEANFNLLAGTLLCWAKYTGSWTDGLFRGIMNCQTDTNNRVIMRKDSANNTFTLQHLGASTNKLVQVTTSTTAWFMAALTWDNNADQVKFYFNGVQQGATQTGLGVMTGPPTTNLLASQSQNFPGSVSDAAVWTKALTAAEIASLYTLGVEQEASRWRNDDGNEAGASWRAAQDTAVNVGVSTTLRLRTLLNATGDPPSTPYRLEYRKTNSYDWRKL